MERTRDPGSSRGRNCAPQTPQGCSGSDFTCLTDRVRIVIDVSTSLVMLSLGDAARLLAPRSDRVGGLRARIRQHGQRLDLGGTLLLPPVQSWSGAVGLSGLAKMIQIPAAVPSVRVDPRRWSLQGPRTMTRIDLGAPAELHDAAAVIDAARSAIASRGCHGDPYQGFMRLDLPDRTAQRTSKCVTFHQYGAGRPRLSCFAHRIGDNWC